MRGFNKQKSGYSLVVLGVIVVIIVILLTTATISAVSMINSANRTSFGTELFNIQSEVDTIVSEGNDIPVINSIVFNVSQINPSILTEQFEGEIVTDNTIIVETLNLQELGITNTKFGNRDTKEDIYAVSKTTNRVYYIQGLKVGNKTYYTLTSDLRNIIEKSGEAQTLTKAILFEPSVRGWTRNLVTVRVKVPTDYTNVAITTTPATINKGATTTENGYNVTTINTNLQSGNYDITVTYTDNGTAKKAVYKVNKFDNISPTIEEITEQKITENGITSLYLKGTVATDSTSGLKVFKYDKGQLTIDNAKEYFETYGSNISGEVIRVEGNTWYSIYAEDNAGNGTLTVIKTSHIEYVKDGLILHYDSINNTGNGHSNTATTWKDLSGNGNDAIFKGAGTVTWEDKAYNFVSPNTNYFETEKSISLGNGPRTIEIVLSLTEDGVMNISGLGTLFANTMQDIIYYTNGINLHAYGNSANEGITTTPLSLGEIYSNTITYSGGKTTYRTNENTKGNVSFYTLNTESTTLLLGIGKYSTHNRNKNFKIQAYRVYNRVLTEQEIQQNYELDKIRFGI